MLKIILAFRYVLWLIVPAIIFSGLAFAIAGVLQGIEGYLMLIRGEIGHGHRPGLMFIESLERFLAALIMFVFGVGLLQLFLLEDEKKMLENKIPEWLKIHDFLDLKLILWETILTSLLIFIVSDVSRNEGSYHWNMAVLPVILFTVTVSLFLLKKSK